MNYPVWELTTWGGGWLIALIAVVHVYVAHFAVGGGLFLVLTEAMGHRRADQSVLDYTRRHARFFLLLTMVFGGLTGVAIWLVISVLHPSATSVLIHRFLFGWATEWVFFLVEIVSLLVYYYTFGKMAPRRHQAVGWIYFVSAWLSLLTVNGIIAFMLTPGRWLATHDFWDGWLNPSFWPSLAFRTCLALVLAGVYGLITATALKDPDLRRRLTRWCATWLLAPFLLMLAAGWWYLAALPQEPRQMILSLNPEMAPALKVLAYTAAALFLGGLALVVRLPRGAARVLAAVLLVVGLGYMGSFEWLREAGRRPYIIAGHMYSNSLLPGQVEQAQREGLLKLAKWSKHKEVTPDNRLEAGRQVFQLLCATCHSVGGPMHDILPLTAKYGQFGLDSQLDGMGKLLGYMPPFAGNLAERSALAAYVALGLHGKPEQPPQEYTPAQLDTPAPPFDPAKDQYLLLAYNDLGMHCFTDGEPWLVLLPPANNIRAQLIKRGESPQIISQGVELTYRLEDGFLHPSKRMDFWKHAQAVFGKELAPDVGLAGKGTSGGLDYDPRHQVYAADLLPVSPYRDTGGFNPYPLVSIEARDQATGQVLARTQAVAPVSSEMGCKNCHGGPWREDGLAGMSQETARDILSVHDRINHTSLKAQAKAGKPVLCASCHPDPALGSAGDGKRLALSAAMHGWHANYMTNRGAESCQSCHPDSPQGPTRCFRGLHQGLGMDCTNCHGPLEDHALGLLKNEQKAGKPQAAALMAQLKPRTVASQKEVAPRAPWGNLPDCLHCHQDFKEPTTMQLTAATKWTAGESDLFRQRGDQAGLRCPSCHGSPHALYPAQNIYGQGRDVIQPRQYQGNTLPLGANKNCKVCHTVDMDSEMHHPNSLRPVRSISP
ncbi:MAG: cytochrome ubiquinol oxidase subunit I [Pseudomonadota bacterium]